jgi:hypothetical protein
MDDLAAWLPVLDDVGIILVRFAVVSPSRGTACRAHLANIHSLSRSIPAHNIVSAMLQAPVLSLHGRLDSMHVHRERQFISDHHRHRCVGSAMPACNSRPMGALACRQAARGRFPVHENLYLYEL